MEHNKVVRKIRSLLALANHNQNEFEASDATKKARQLMKKFKIELREIEQSDSEDISLATYEIKEDSRYASRWEYALAEIVARNCRCETYNIEQTNSIVFYGYTNDINIARELFKYLYTNGNRLSEQYYKKFKRENTDKEKLMYTFLFGFCNGVQEVLNKQCRNLMLVVPQKVKDSFKEYSKGFNRVTNILEISDDENAYWVGKREGKDSINARSIESQVS